MVQTCRVLYSRKQWKKKAVKRGLKVREMRKAINRKNEQIEQLKAKLANQNNLSEPSPKSQEMQDNSLKKTL